MSNTTTYDEAMVKAMIAQAVAKEREECAKVCSDLHLDGDDDNGLAADLIRARGQA